MARDILSRVSLSKQVYWKGVADADFFKNQPNVFSMGSLLLSIFINHPGFFAIFGQLDECLPEWGENCLLS